MAMTGKISFNRMDSVSFGRPAGEVITEEAHKLGAGSVFLMVSNTLNNKTEEIESVRRTLGNLYSGTFDSMAPHTPRTDVIRATIAARKANEIPDKVHHVIAIEFLRAFQALNLSINRTV